MAQTIKIGEEVTVGNVAVEYLIEETVVILDKPNQIFAIECNSANSGTIQFSVGITPPSAQKAYIAGSKLILSGVSNGFRNIWALGSAAGQKFTVS
jgi:hypothetical protein